MRINDFREVFEPFYRLSICEVVVEPRGLRLSLRPFDEFGRSQSPDWWKAYNKVKHNLSVNFRKATFRRVLSALSGLFLLNVLHLDAREFLIENKILKGYFSEYTTHPGTFKVVALKERYAQLQHFEIEVDDCLVFVSKMFLFQVAGSKENWQKHNLYWFQYV